MKKNEHGAIVSVRDMAEVEGPCVCSICGETFTPSASRDCFPLEEEKDDQGEMPLQCERCFDNRALASGAAIVEITPSGIEVTRPRSESQDEGEDQASLGTSDVLEVRAHDYLTVMRQLPPPTQEQTANFARYVSQAHSWYKHLPFDPGLPFCFYLDPNAGRNMVYRRQEDAAFSDVSGDARREHYNMLPTEDYRERFGFWTYHAPYGSWTMFTTRDEIVDTKGHLTFCMLDSDRRTEWVKEVFAMLDAAMRQRDSEGGDLPDEAYGFVIKGAYPDVSIQEDPPIILASSGRWVDVPIDVLSAGSVLLTAAAHPNRNLRMYVVYDEDSREPLRFPDFLGRDLRFVPQDVRKAMERLNALYQSALYIEERQRARDSERAAGAQAGQPGFSWEETRSCRREQAILDQLLYPAMERERARQLAAMEAAMHRFLEAAL